MAQPLNRETWALQEMTLDYADQMVRRNLIANAADASGRGIDLTITDHGEAVSLEGMSVYLVWSHSAGVCGETEFDVYDAACGKARLYYPQGMMAEGSVLARISIYVGESEITGSRNFSIEVEPCPVSDGQAMADDDFSVFVQATIDLHELSGQATTVIQEATDAKDAANDAARSANDAADSANAATRDANDAAQAANGAAESATSAAGSANSAADAANDAADRANAAAGDLTWVWLTDGDTKTMAISYMED